MHTRVHRNRRIAVLAIDRERKPLSPLGLPFPRTFVGNLTISPSRVANSILREQSSHSAPPPNGLEMRDPSCASISVDFILDQDLEGETKFHPRKNPLFSRVYCRTVRVAARRSRRVFKIPEPWPKYSRCQIWSYRKSTERDWKRRRRHSGKSSNSVLSSFLSVISAVADEQVGTRTLTRIMARSVFVKCLTNYEYL